MAGSSFIFVLYGQSDSLQITHFKQLVILWLCECGLIATWLKTRNGKAERKRRGWHLILPLCGFPNSRLLCYLFRPVWHPNSAHYHPLWHTLRVYSPSCLQTGPFATCLVKPRLFDETSKSVKTFWILLCAIMHLWLCLCVTKLW